MKMKMTFMFVIAAAFGAPLVCGCGSSDPGPSEISAQQAEQKAAAVVPGTPSATQKIDTTDEHRWVVSIKHASGAVIDVEIERASGVVAEITSETAPFDYDLPAPAPSFLPYAQAKAKALDTKAGAVEKWEARLLDAQWEFYVRDADTRLFEVKMTADKGEVTTVEQKDKPD